MSSLPRTNDDLKRIGAAFAQLREDRGYSQAELARESHTAQATISRIESGRYDYKTTILKRLLDFLKCELGDFYVKAGFTKETTDFKRYTFTIDLDAKGLRNITGHVSGPNLRQVSEKRVGDVSN